MNTARETGDYRPTPQGEYSGETRVATLAALLAKSEPPKEPRPTVIGRIIAFVAWVLFVMVAPASAQITAKFPPLTPAQAAAVLTGPAMLANRTAPAPAPQQAVPSVVVHSTPGAPTWLPMPLSSEPRRLDGTLLTQPLQVYGPSSVVIVQDTLHKEH